MHDQIILLYYLFIMRKHNYISRFQHFATKLLATNEPIDEKTRYPLSENSFLELYY